MDSNTHFKVKTHKDGMKKLNFKNAAAMAGNAFMNWLEKRETRKDAKTSQSEQNRDQIQCLNALHDDLETLVSSLEKSYKDGLLDSIPDGALIGSNLMALGNRILKMKGKRSKKTASSLQHQPTKKPKIEFEEEVVEPMLSEEPGPSNFRPNFPQPTAPPADVVSDTPQPEAHSDLVDVKEELTEDFNDDSSDMEVFYIDSDDEKEYDGLPTLKVEKDHNLAQILLDKNTELEDQSSTIRLLERKLKAKDVINAELKGQLEELQEAHEPSTETPPTIPTFNLHYVPTREDEEMLAQFFQMCVIDLDTSIDDKFLLCKKYSGLQVRQQFYAMFMWRCHLEVKDKKAQMGWSSNLTEYEWMKFLLTFVAKINSFDHFKSCICLSEEVGGESNNTQLRVVRIRPYMRFYRVCGSVLRIVSFRFISALSFGSAFISGRQASHRCGHRNCVNINHAILEIADVNLSREKCFKGKQRCSHTPKCLFNTQHCFEPTEFVQNDSLSMNMEFTTTSDQNRIVYSLDEELPPVSAVSYVFQFSSHDAKYDFCQVMSKSLESSQKCNLLDDLKKKGWIEADWSEKLMFNRDMNKMDTYVQGQTRYIIFDGYRFLYFDGTFFKCGQDLQANGKVQAACPSYIRLHPQSSDRILTKNDHLPSCKLAADRPGSYTRDYRQVKWINPKCSDKKGNEVDFDSPDVDSIEHDSYRLKLHLGTTMFVCHQYNSDKTLYCGLQARLQETKDTLLICGEHESFCKVRFRS
ncbi:Zf-His-Me-endon domain-containing protein [Aphelenchoides besseyi]|nr:Zf-His-Me-endon domain-containing protein [Aphelenchoides besseyi]